VQESSLDPDATEHITIVLACCQRKIVEAPGAETAPAHGSIACPIEGHSLKQCDTQTIDKRIGPRIVATACSVPLLKVLLMCTTPCYNAVLMRG
jgi:hypothetical protein